MRNLGGAIGIAACGTILKDRTNLHFLRLAEHLNATNGAMAERLRLVSARGATVFDDPLHGQAGALKELWALNFREAQVLTYSDAFAALGACFAVATAMVLLMRKVAPPAGPPAEAH